MIFETFVHRKKLAEKGAEPDIYTYDSAPEHLRYQICLALREGIGGFYFYQGHEMQHIPEANEAWEVIDKTCRKEIYSYLNLTTSSSLLDRYTKYLMGVSEMDDFLSAVEIGCRILEHFSEKTRGRGERKKNRKTH